MTAPNLPRREPLGPPPMDTAVNTEFRRLLPEADRQGITAQETFDLAIEAARRLLRDIEACLEAYAARRERFPVRPGEEAYAVDRPARPRRPRP